MEPAVCEPIATGQTPMATDTAEPLEEVPGVIVISCGLSVSLSLCTANSAVTVLPGIIAPVSYTHLTLPTKRIV